MKRSDFFKRLGLGAAAVIVAPKVIAEALEEVKDESMIERMKPLVDSYEKSWRNINSNKAEWFEETRHHELIEAEVIIKLSVDKITTVTKESPEESKFRLKDIVMINTDSYLVIRIGEENINHTIVELQSLYHHHL